MPATRTLYIGLDACDLHVAQEFARRGDMPVLARLLDTAAVQETRGPLGFFVSSNWPTIYTGTTPSRHRFLCGGEVRGGTYDPVWNAPLSDLPAVWDWVSDAGQRVAVLDPPHASVKPVNGVQLVEWGCHDRHTGTASFPPSFAAEVDATYGPYVMSQFGVVAPHYAPCDYAHRAGAHRTVAENGALLDDLLESHRRKQALTNGVLARGGWDLFFAVFAEAHCAGHQMWKLHDPTHPWHDAGVLRAIGGDPLRRIYAEIDRSVGELLETAGDDGTIYLHLSHGMRAHFDGMCLLEPLLWRLDQYASRTDARGVFTRATDAAVGALPRAARRPALSALMDVRRRLRSRSPIADTRPLEIPEWMGQRRWWMQPNDSVYGSVRMNVQGREPNGRIAAAQRRDAALWLADRFLELVNVETGEAAVAHMYLTDDHYERFDGDAFGDLIVEWNRRAPLDHVWSPATGVVSAPYDGWRTGDHHRGGLLLAIGPGVAPGRRPGKMPVVDVAPTLAASLGVDVPFFDGVPHTDLLPVGVAHARVPAVIEPRTAVTVAARPSGPRRWSARRRDVQPNSWIEHYAVGLSRSIHVDHGELHELRAEVERLRARVDDLDQLARITQVTAWLRQVDVPESLLVSVVMPTRNRVRRLERAIETVRSQTYPHWELLVVDDASTDATSARLEQLAREDPRIRPFRLEEQHRSSGARNHALDHAKGDVLAYLDDDNCFDPDWLRAVVWAFNEYPETQVCYGARVIDDDARHQGLASRSLPIIQFNAWDRATMLQRNLVDQNVIAHRPSPVRFDHATDHFSDWDVLLQLTDECDPLALPVVAAHYYSDVADRLSVDFADPEFVDKAVEYVRRRAIERRRADA